MCSKRKISKSLLATWTDQWRMVTIPKSNTCGMPSLMYGWKFKMFMIKIFCSLPVIQTRLRAQTVIYFINLNTLTLHWSWGLNPNYCPGQRGFKFIVPLNAFRNTSAPIPALHEEFKVHTLHQGQNFRVKHKHNMFLIYRRITEVTNVIRIKTDLLTCFQFGLLSHVSNDIVKCLRSNRAPPLSPY